MSAARTITRIGLGAGLAFAGLTHLTIARKAFRAQVPKWVPAKPDTVVLASGIAEIGLGAKLIFDQRQRRLVGYAAAAFFIAVFPGNISQYRNRVSAFGLDTDRKRLVRLFFQPLLVAAALFGTRD